LAFVGDAAELKNLPQMRFETAVDKLTEAMPPGI
jgi:hypothetical protein